MTDRYDEKLRDDVIEAAIDELLEGDDMDFNEEAAMEVNGEAAAKHASSAASGSAKKKQAARKGDKLSADDEPGVLPGAGNGSDTPGQTAKLEAKMKEEDDMEDDDDDDEEDMDESVDFSEDLDALVASEATLSESFREKAELIFEAAFNAKVEKEVTRLEERYQEAMMEEVEAIQSDLVEKVDSYLNYVVSNWMEENELAVESGIRAEIAESFMTSLQSVFKEHYIEVPEGKEDLVDSLANRVEELEESLNEVMSDNIELTEQNSKLFRESVIRSASRNLSEAQTEKLIGLAENVEFVDEEDFSNKIDTLKESYFGAKKVIAEENQPIDGEPLNENVSPHMEKYLAALRTISN